MSKIKDKQRRKRSEIVEVAISLMKDTPFEDLSVTAVCEAAGISTGTFYHYFEKKSDILVGFLSLVDDDLSANTFHLLTNENESENLYMLAIAFAQHVVENGIGRSWLVTGTEISDYSLAGSKREIQCMLETIFSRGQASGQFSTSKSPEELSHYFLILMRGVATDWTRRNGTYSIVEYMKEYITFFLSSFTAK